MDRRSSPLTALRYGGFTLSRLTFAIVLLALISAVPAHATFWDIESAYSGDFGAGDTSLAVSSANIPYISYTANSGLYMAYKTVNGWTSELVRQVGYWGGMSATGFNSNAQPCTAFVDASGSTNYLKYTYKASSSWAVETVDTVGWLPDYVSLAFNPSGQACIAYCRISGSHTYVSFARRTGANTWVKQDIMEVDSVTGPSLAIDSSDNEYVTFAESSSRQLILASRTGTNPWLVQALDGSAGNPVIRYTALALQPDKSPAVAYFLSQPGAVQLKLAARVRNAWQTETAAVLPVGGSYYCSLAVTPGGIPLIAYYNPATRAFNNAWKCGGAWFTEELDSSTECGYRPCMKFDSLGNVEVSYFDNYESNVKYAWAPVPRAVNEVKTMSDQTVQISGVVATTAANEAGNRIYVQTSDRSSGIQLAFSSGVPPVTRGMVLDLQGDLSTTSGERVINDPDLMQIDSLGEPKAVGMGNLSVGGADFHYVSGLHPTGQRGVKDGAGLNNIGLLVRTWGKVTSRGTGYFVIDDGSGVLMKCYSPGITAPLVGKYVVVKGISTCEQSGSDLLRMVWARNAADVVTYTP